MEILWIATFSPNLVLIGFPVSETTSFTDDDDDDDDRDDGRTLMPYYKLC